MRPVGSAAGWAPIVIVADQGDVGRLLAQLAVARAMPPAELIQCPAARWPATLAELDRRAPLPVVLLATTTSLSAIAVAALAAATACRVVVLLVGAARELRWPRSLPCRPPALTSASWLEACGWAAFETPEEAVAALRLLAAGLEPRGAATRIVGASRALAPLMAQILAAAHVPTAGAVQGPRSPGRGRAQALLRGTAAADAPRAPRAGRQAAEAKTIAVLMTGDAPGAEGSGARSMVLHLALPGVAATRTPTGGGLYVELVDLRALGLLLRAAGLAAAPREEAPAPEVASSERPRRAPGVGEPRSAPEGAHAGAAANADQAVALAAALRRTEGSRLGDLATKALLAPFGCRAPLEQRVRSASAAAQVVASAGGPVALRVLTRGPGLGAASRPEQRRVAASAPQARQAFHELLAAQERADPAAVISGVLASRVPPLAPGGLEGGLIALGPDWMLYLRWRDDARARSPWVLARLPAAPRVAETAIDRLLAAIDAGERPLRQGRRERALLRRLIFQLSAAAAGLSGALAWVGLHHVALPCEGAEALLIETAAALRG